jgi:hypothetical protein
MENLDVEKLEDDEMERYGIEIRHLNSCVSTSTSPGKMLTRTAKMTKSDS